MAARQPNLYLFIRMTGVAAFGGAVAPSGAVLRLVDLGAPREDEVGAAGTKRAAETLQKARAFAPPHASGVDAEEAGAAQERVARHADEAAALAAKAAAKREEAVATPSLSVLRDEADGHAKAAARALVRAIEAHFAVTTRCAAAFDAGGAAGAASASHLAALRAHMSAVEHNVRRLRLVSGLYPRVGSDATLDGGRLGKESPVAAVPGRPSSIDVDAMFLRPTTVRALAEVEADADVQRALREVAEARGAAGDATAAGGSVGQAAAAAALEAEACLTQLFRARHEEEGDVATDATRRAMFEAAAEAGAALKGLAGSLAAGGAGAEAVEPFSALLDSVLATTDAKAEGGPAEYGAAAAAPVSEAATACEEACGTDPTALLAAGRATRRAVDAGLGEAAKVVERPLERLAEARRALARIRRQQEEEEEGRGESPSPAALQARRKAASAVDAAERAVRAAARAVRVATRVNKARLERLERRARDGGSLGETPCEEEEAELADAAAAATRVALHAPEAEASPCVEATVVGVEKGEERGAAALARAAAGGATSLHLWLLPVGAEAPHSGAVPCALPLTAGDGTLSPPADGAAASLSLQGSASACGDVLVVLADAGSGAAVLQGAVAMRDVSDASPPRAGANAAHTVQVAMAPVSTAGSADATTACTVQLEVAATLPRCCEARCIAAAGAALASLPTLCERARSAAARGLRVHFAARADAVQRKWAVARSREAAALEEARCRKPPMSTLLSQASRLRRLRRRTLLQARSLWVVPLDAKLEALRAAMEAAEGVEGVRRQRAAAEERRAEAEAEARRVREAERAVEEALRRGSADLAQRLARETEAARRERVEAKGAMQGLEQRQEAAVAEQGAWEEKTAALRRRVGRELVRLTKRAKFLRRQDLQALFQSSPVAAMLTGGEEDAPAATTADVRAAEDEAEIAIRVGKAKVHALARGAGGEDENALERLRQAVRQSSAAHALPTLPDDAKGSAEESDEEEGEEEGRSKKEFGLWDATVGWVMPEYLLGRASSRE